MVDFKTAYGKKIVQNVECKEKTKTIQHLKDKCDINNIIKRFTETGVLESSNRKAFYGDCDSSFDYRSALDKVIKAQESFDSLPAKVRQRFRNDPSELLSFLDNRDNDKEAVELGLLKPNDVKSVEPVVTPEVKKA